jgi:hypothetical protein
MGFIKMAFKRIQSLGPIPPIGLEPSLEFGKRFRIDAVQATLAFRRYVHQAGITQDAQMFRNHGLAHANDFDQVVNRLGAIEQRVEKAPPIGIG